LFVIENDAFYMGHSLKKVLLGYQEAMIKSFSQLINKQLKGQKISEVQVKAINDKINELAKELEDIRPGKEEEKIDYVKKITIESKTAILIQQIVNVLPQVTETVTTFAPLAPFSKLIGK
jgi:hypothetical protein